MGLIKMFTSAVGSTFADQVVEYFRCEDMSTKILCQPATLVKRGKTVNNGTEGVISNGSRFDVAVNQAALLIENGRVHDFVIGTQETAGQYKYDSTVSPSLLGGGWGDLGASIKEIGRRFTAGGQAMNTMRLIYINLRPLPGNKIGFGKIPFRDGEMNLTLNAQGHGQYELQIVNPMNFYENVVQNVNKVLTVDSPDGVAVLGQLKADMTPKFQKALTRISAQKIPYDQLGLYPDELAEAMNAELEEKWAAKGVKITSLAIELNVDEESKQRIAKFQEAKTVGSDPSMLYAMDRMSINKAREAAASNSNGVMAGFMGMGMAGGMSGAAVKPIALRMVWQVAKAVNIPVIGLGGIMGWKDAVEFMLAGATAIQIGTANFIDPAITVKVSEGINDYLERHGYTSVKDIIGALEI